MLFFNSGDSFERCRISCVKPDGIAVTVVALQSFLANRVRIYKLFGLVGEDYPDKIQGEDEAEPAVLYKISRELT